MTPIPGFPDYAIDENDGVWRVTPSVRDAQYGPVPRKIAVVQVGSKGRRVPGVHMTRRGEVSTVKTLASIRKLVS